MTLSDEAATAVAHAIGTGAREVARCMDLGVTRYFRKPFGMKAGGDQPYTYTTGGHA